MAVGLWLAGDVHFSDSLLTGMDGLISLELLRARRLTVFSFWLNIFDIKTRRTTRV